MDGGESLFSLPQSLASALRLVIKLGGGIVSDPPSIPRFLKLYLSIKKREKVSVSENSCIQPRIHADSGALLGSGVIRDRGILNFLLDF